MKISIFGLGYVGAVTAACLTRDGHNVVGVDVNPDKVRMIQKGESPVVEPGIEKLLPEAVAKKLLSATTDAAAAVVATDISLVCVGTPAKEKGSPNLDHVFYVCEQIARSLGKKATTHVVVIRSTVPPGTLEACEALMAKHADRSRFHLAFNPEFLREGSAIRDYDAPPFTIIGTTEPAAEKAVREIYKTIQAPVFVVQPRESELIKYLCNTWHAVKVSFANEVGRLARPLEIDARRVMDVFLSDTKLNVSPVYMRPGFAYGGSCLPKDVSALIHMAQDKGVHLPVIGALPQSNQAQIDSTVARILQMRARKIAVFGLAFKANTDDLRESPVVLLVKRLIGEGREIRIYDPAVNQAKLMGTNLNYIRENLPHFESLMKIDPAEALKDAELLVVTQNHGDFRKIILAHRPAVKHVFDLAGLFSEPPEGIEYHGVAW